MHFGRVNGRYCDDFVERGDLHLHKKMMHFGRVYDGRYCEVANFAERGRYCEVANNYFAERYCEVANFVERILRSCKLRRATAVANFAERGFLFPFLGIIGFQSYEYF